MLLPKKLLVQGPGTNQSQKLRSIHEYKELELPLGLLSLESVSLLFSHQLLPKQGQ